MVEEQEFEKEVTAVVVVWVIQVKLSFGHFLSISSSKDTIEIEDIG